MPEIIRSHFSVCLHADSFLPAGLPPRPAAPPLAPALQPGGKPFPWLHLNAQTVRVHTAALRMLFAESASSRCRTMSRAFSSYGELPWLGADFQLHIAYQRAGMQRGMLVLVLGGSHGIKAITCPGVHHFPLLVMPAVLHAPTCSAPAAGGRLCWEQRACGAVCQRRVGHRVR